MSQPAPSSNNGSSKQIIVIVVAALALLLAVFSVVHTVRKDQGQNLGGKLDIGGGKTAAMKGQPTTDPSGAPPGLEGSGGKGSPGR